MLRYSFLPAVLYPVLFLYTYNIGQSSLSSALKILLLCLILFSGLFILLKKMRYTADAASLIVTIIATLLFSYGHIYTCLRNLARHWIALLDLSLKNKILSGTETFFHIILCTVFIGMIIFICRSLRRGKVTVTKKTLSALSAIFISLILLTGFNLLKSVKIYAGFKPQIHSLTDSISRDTPQLGPDIYYIILDGFTRPDVMKNLYKTDLEDFIDPLREMGFYIADKSHSNYSETILSLSSSLNMNYLDLFEDPVLKYKRNTEMIRNNEVIRFLKQRGYQYVHVSSVWSPTLTNPNSDIEVSYPKWVVSDEFFRTFFSTTWLRIFDFLMGAGVAKVHLYNFAQLEKIAESSSSPKFVFAHFVLPHSPYVFDRNGKIKSEINMVNIWEKENNIWNDAEGYRDQVLFTSKMTLLSIIGILQNSKNPPVIIIQGDHGTNLVYSDSEKLPFRDKAIYVRHAILNAYLFPDQNYSELYPDISPVNSFRIIFNHFFGTDFEILPDTVHYTSLD
ncbi:MAG: hypothetical protein KC649_04795 [Candidatus Omnitrophica bacterium]|nr:hypothetical protein [Candidatus Omnitrophota bacterium]